MKKIYLVFLLLLSHSLVAQDISGYWQGVDYSPKSATTTYWASLLNIQQNGSTLTGTLYQYAPNKPQYFLEVEVTGTIQNDKFQIKTGKVIRDNAPPGSYWCVNGQGTFTYNAVEESLKGTLIYANCQSNSSTFELYAVKPKTKLRYCKDEKIAISVTGQDIKWYDSAQKTKLLGSGNTFEPAISQTTTFYATQTHYNTESPAAPITITIAEPKIVSLDITPSSCELSNGSVKVTASGDVPLTYSLDALNFQAQGQFDKLAAQSYTVAVKDSNGCTLRQNFAVAGSGKPTIAEVKLTATTCGLENGAMTITASGGSGALLYGYDGGNFSATPGFEKMKAGSYVMEVKDEKGCKDTRSVAIASSDRLTIMGLMTELPSCGANDGRIVASASGGKAPLSFSVDSVHFQSSASFPNLIAGEYSVSAQDADGCRVSQRIQIHSDCNAALHFPTSFSPNGDGINDTFNLYFSSGEVKILRFMVYDRWGVAIYGFDNRSFVTNGDVLWDGNIDGSKSPAQAYSYVLEVEFGNGETFVYRSTVLLLR
jgi:gliding motility-associated-like protein